MSLDKEWACGTTWATHLTLSKVKQKVVKAREDPFFFLLFGHERGEERERERELQLLSTIYEDRLVEIRRAKNESSSTRRGLRMDIGNTGFHRGFKKRVWEIKDFGFRKCPRDFLEFLIHFKR